MTAVPLPIWPFPMSPAQADITRRAFVSLGLPYAVQPVPAVIGEPGRILALGAVPPFLCDCAPVTDPSNFDSVRNAIAWVLCAPPESQDGWMVRDYLTSIFGPKVRELESELV